MASPEHRQPRCWPGAPPAGRLGARSPRRTPLGVPDALVAAAAALVLMGPGAVCLGVEPRASSDGHLLKRHSEPT